MNHHRLCGCFLPAYSTIFSSFVLKKTDFNLFDTIFLCLFNDIQNFKYSTKFGVLHRLKFVDIHISLQQNKKNDIKKSQNETEKFGTDVIQVLV